MADVIITTFNPSEYGLTRSCGVNITKYNRVISVLKNRNGDNNMSFVVYFNGKYNEIQELLNE